MPGSDQVPASIIDSTLERAQRLERAALHIARAVELELADRALSGARLDSDDPQTQSLRKLGAAFLRVSSLGMNAANSIAAALGEAPVVTQPTESAQPPAEQPHGSDTVLEPVFREPSLSKPDASLVAGTVDVPETSRLTRQHTSAGAAAEVRTQGAHEKQKPRYEGALYARIIPPTETPIMELRYGMESIPVRIIADDTIVINGEKVELEGDQLFIFNALMKLRDSMMTAKEMRSLGFRLEGSSASQTFNKALTGLMAELEQTGDPSQPAIIKKVGQAAGTKYAVNPAVVLQDERLDVESDGTDSATPETVKKN